jgi:hypothetical protein
MDSLIATLRDSSRPTNVHEAVNHLDHVEAELHRRGDLRGAFASLYAVVTRNVERTVQDPRGPFLEPQWISTLAGRFAARYLDTLAMSTRANGHDCAAWRAAYAACEAQASPLRCGVLGLSAHILADLALGIAGLLDEEKGLTPARLAIHKADHDAINGVLDASTPDVLAELDSRYDCAAARALRSDGFAGALWAARAPLQLARAVVWRDALALHVAPTRASRAATRRRVLCVAAAAGAALAAGTSAAGPFFATLKRSA